MECGEDVRYHDFYLLTHSLTLECSKFKEDADDNRNVAITLSQTSPGFYVFAIQAF